MRERINSKKFVKAWMTNETVEGVAKALGLERSQVSAKANSLRKKGVNLPKKHGSTRDEYTVDELNALVASYSPQVKSVVNTKPVSFVRRKAFV